MSAEVARVIARDFDTIEQWEAAVREVGGRPQNPPVLVDAGAQIIPEHREGSRT
jgi:hypothetical protein